MSVDVMYFGGLMFDYVLMNILILHGFEMYLYNMLVKSRLVSICVVHNIFVWFRDGSYVHNMVVKYGHVFIVLVQNTFVTLR